MGSTARSYSTPPVPVAVLFIDTLQRGVTLKTSRRFILEKVRRGGCDRGRSSGD